MNIAAKITKYDSKAREDMTKGIDILANAVKNPDQRSGLLLMKKPHRLGG